MRIKNILRNGLIYSLVVSFCLISTPFKANAVDFNDFLSFMEELEAKAPPGATQNLPFNSQQVRAVQGIIGCMEDSGNDIDVAICVDQFHDTDLGQQASSEADIPSWAWDILDAYIMYRTGDYWGLAQKLGEAVACVVIQILVGGVDVCGLLEELVKIAQDLWDAAKAVAQFIASVGGAVWDGIKDVGCSLGLGGCDDSPPTPPEVWIYTYIFDTKLGEGLAARKSMDNLAFTNLVDQLKANAASKPPVYSTPIPPDPFGAFKQIIENACANSGAVDRAAKVFISAVNTQWTSDLGNNVLPERANRFAQYNNKNNAQFLTNGAIQTYTGGQSWDPKGFIVNKCSTKFGYEYMYLHIDRWRLMANTLGQQAIDLKDAVQGNVDMCNSFWSQRRNDIAEYVYNHVKSQYCASHGDTLMCGGIDDYRACSALLKPFGDEEKCSINTYVAGKEAAQKVYQEAMKMGSSLPPWLTMPPPVSAGVSSQPYTLIGHRPTHAYYCQSIYDNLYGDIPKKLVSCAQKPDAAYLQLVTAVKNAVDEMNQTVAYNGLQAGLFYDPLAVLAATPSLVHELMDTNKKDFGFKPPSKPGFDYSISAFPKSLDGLSTPMIFYDLAGEIEKHMKEKAATLTEVNIEEKIDPLGPITDKISGIDEVTRLTAPIADKSNRATLSKASTIKQVSTQSISAQTIGGQQHQNGQQHTMSGTLPENSTLQKPSQTFSTTAKLDTTKSNITTQLADLQVTNTLKINGKKASWNKTVTLDGSSLKHSSGGRCQVPVFFSIKNGGTVGSSVNQFEWKRISAPQILAPLAPGQTKSINTTLLLPAGKHQIELLLDKLKQVQESDEENNVGVVRLQINGSCSQQSKLKSPASKSSKKPGTILPIKKQ